ncbi:hypothetical protein AOA59_27915 [Pseudomonas sp. 2822-15]|nr:hypothetical protein AOA59_27915 [Pseudomonas sp. 2822-15]
MLVREVEQVPGSWKGSKACEALLDVSRVLANCLQGTTYIISYIRMSVGFYVEGQLHQGVTVRATHRKRMLIDLEDATRESDSLAG